MFLGIFHVLINARDEDALTALVSREANVHLKALHHLGDGLPASSDQAAVDAMIQNQLFGDLLLLYNASQKTGDQNTPLGRVIAKRKCQIVVSNCGILFFGEDSEVNIHMNIEPFFSVLVRC